MAASYEVIADYVTVGNWEDQGASAHSYPTQQDNVLTVDLSGLNSDGRALADRALDAWENVAALRFNETSDAQITFTNDDRGAITNSSWTAGEGDTVSSNVNVPTAWVDRYGSGQDSYAQQVYIHEIGHALGLGHLGVYNRDADFESSARFANDSWHTSVMSYFSQDETPIADGDKAYAVTPMMVDILAIQDLYGAPGGNSATGGNTVYSPNGTAGSYLNGAFDALASSGTNPVTLTVYDTGGNDTLDLSFSSKGDDIELSGNSFSKVDGIQGALGIAGGTVIENANSGAGWDNLAGNWAENTLRAGGGNDTAYGKAGADTLRGGSGEDTLYGGSDNDQLYGGAGADELGGSDGDDIAYGSYGDDTLYAGSGRDEIGGGYGDDTHWAGNGSDTVYAFDGDDLVGGGSGNDELWGGNGSDEIFASTGQDRLGGGSGADELYGGGGSDTLYGVDASDRVAGGAGDDILWGGSSSDTVDGAAGDDALYGGTGYDVLRGGSGDDTLTGGNGDSADAFVFSAGNDVITDFQGAEGDILRLDSSLWSGDLSKDQVFNRYASTEGGDSVLSFDGGNELRVEDINSTDWLAENTFLV